MNRKYIKKALAIILGIAMLPALAAVPEEKVHAEESVEIPDRMKQIAENSELELYFDEERTDIAVRVRDTGDIWFSNPPAADEDSFAGNYYKNLMKSQFSLRYYNESVQASEMDNYNDAIANGQFSFEYTGDGVSITYNLGEVADKYVLPQIISAERYESYVAQMDKDAAKKVGRNYTCLNPDEMKTDDLKSYIEKYPSLENGTIYVLKEGTKDYKKEEVMAAFAEVGYTVEDMHSDNEANGFESVNEKAWFNVTLEYKLDGDNLLASLDPRKVEYDSENYSLVHISLLQYFGAAGADEEGYLFVPDGSGALIEFNNGKTSTPSYTGYCYGEDKTNLVNTEKKTEIDQSVTVKMPVFGLKKADKAFFAIIESGDANADINADVSGRTESYNNVYAGFGYLSYGSISMGEVVGAHSFQMYSQPEFAESYTVRYGFLHGEEADYSGMARYYQDYLKEQGVFGEKITSDVTPMYINFVGAIQKWSSFMGIKHKKTQELTTYAQASDAIAQLESAGVEGIKVEYSGWSTGGLHGTAPGGIKVLGCLNESGVKLKDFLQEMQEKDIPVFHTAQLQYVYKDTLADGYSPESYAPRYYDKTVVTARQYLIPNGYWSRKDGVTQMISPYFVEDMADTLIQKTAKYNLAGVDIDTLSGTLFSDFYDKRYTDRQMAQTKNCAAMEKIAEAYAGAVMGSNANAYAWQYVSDITETPFDSNRAQIINDVIPFYAMVIHGYRDFTGEAMNLSDDITTLILKSVETGSGVSFEWICGDNSLLKDTDFDSLYSVNFEVWRDKAVEIWQQVNDATGFLRDQRIVQHERLENGVYRTTFEDGTQVIVNYNRESVSYEGKTLGAQDFLVVKEG